MPTLTMKPRCLHHYFVKENSSLYYVLDYDPDKNFYRVENCKTNKRLKVNSDFLREEVKWIDARSSSS